MLEQYLHELIWCYHLLGEAGDLGLPVLSDHQSEGRFCSKPCKNSPSPTTLCPESKARRLRCSQADLGGIRLWLWSSWDGFWSRSELSPISVSPLSVTGQNKWFAPNFFVWYLLTLMRSSKNEHFGKKCRSSIKYLLYTGHYDKSLFYIHSPFIPHKDCFNCLR